MAHETESADAVVVGSGPNGLAGAVVLARAGLRVRVVESADELGGGCRTAELTLPGFRHDVCAGVHPLAAASPFFGSVALLDLGCRLVHPPTPLAHPLGGTRAAVLHRSLSETATALGPDARAYAKLVAPLDEEVLGFLLSPMRSLPARPAALATVGLRCLRSAVGLAGGFSTTAARALLAGLSAHSMMPLDQLGTGGFAVVLASLAHSVGWPVAEGGSSSLVAALVAELDSLGASFEVRHVDRLDQLHARTILLDIGPDQLLSMSGDLPSRYAARLRRFRHGPGVCKVDWALAGPVPWTAAECMGAGTVHVGGTLEEIAASEATVGGGRHAARPFVLLSQPCVADPTRAPAGQHTLWGYCHVPAGSDVDMTEAIEKQIDRFAPGWRDLILARSVRTAADLATYNRNYVGGDINGGAATLMQTLFRPLPAWNPYRTPLPGVYLCSSSTPPGGGVHGMCGLNAARTALGDLRNPASHSQKVRSH